MAKADRVRRAGARGIEDAFDLLLVRSRVVVVVPVVVLVVCALGAFAWGTAVFVHSVGDVVRHPFPVGGRIGLFLLVVDLFLIGATLLIAALGFYELFLVSRTDGPPAERMPDWLQMRDLNDLKARVIAMAVLVMAVSFVEVVVDVSPGLDVLELGGGVALVIGALTAFVRFGSAPSHAEGGDAPPGDAPPGDAPPGDAPPGDAPPGEAPRSR